MTYIPLHHKYRPQTFTQLVGQDAIATTLSNALLQNRIAPAYLFTGARGTGKTSSARIFAKSLNCLASDSPTDQPCGVCETCRAIANGSALDVIEIDAASNTGVDHIRELIERAQFAPVQCRYKVYVVDECLTGDSLIQTSEGLSRIDDPNLKGKQVLSYNEKTNDWEYKKILRWLNQGKRQVYTIKTTQRTIRCTGNHLIRTDQGWIPAKDVKEKTKILSPVPVAAESLFTSTAQMDGSGALLGGISSSTINLGVNHTIWNPYFYRRSLFAHSVLANVEKNWSFPTFFDKKAKDWFQFNLTGSITLISKGMDSGNSAPQTLWNQLNHFCQNKWVWFMEPSWEMALLDIPIPIAASHEWCGHMEWHKNPGCLTKPNNSNNSNLNSQFIPIEDTAKRPFDVSLSAIPTYAKLPTWFARTGGKKQFRPHGWNGSHLKEELGGTSMMVLFPFLQPEVRKFSFIQKGFPTQKITFWLSGLLNWATTSRFAPIFVQALEKLTTISQWGQTLLGNGSQTINASPSLQWTTNLEVVESVSLGGIEEVYDIEVEDNHNFVANGLLVHNCHMLSAAAFNALLKTLEEPPDRVVFVLATTDPQRVLPTIISRCQRFDFRRIPLEPMVQHLGAIAQKESIPITQEALQLIAQISQGGLRDAESLLDQLSLLIGEITSERVWDLVGAVPERDLMTLAEAIASDHPEAVLDTTRKLMDRGREPLIVLQNLASFYRDLLIAKTARDRGDLVALTPPTWQQLCNFATDLNISTILAGQKHLKDSEIQLKTTTQPRLWLEVTLLGLLPSAVSLQPVNVSPSLKAPVELTERAISAERNSVGNAQSLAEPIATSDALPSPTSPNGSLATPDAAPSPTEEIVPSQDSTPAQQDLTDLWQRVLSNLQPLGIQALLSQQGSLLSFDGQTAQVSIKEKLFNIAQGRVANIKAAFLKTLGIEVKLSLVVASAALSEQSSAHSESMSGSDTKPLSTEQDVTERNLEDVPFRPSEPTPSDPTEAVATSTPQPDPDLAILGSLAEPIAAPDDSPTLEAPPAYYHDWEDEVTRAALNLADAFNGAVVDLDNPSLEPPSLSIEEQVSSLDEAALDELEDNEEEDQDVDF